MKQILMLFFFTVLSSIFLGLLKGSSCLHYVIKPVKLPNKVSQLLNFQKKNQNQN